MFRSLITARRFAPLFWTQFFSAFNDNFLKNALVFLILFGVGMASDPAHAGMLVTLASSIFIVPYFFLSGIGGELADRYDKALIAQRLKLAETGAAAVAVVGFALGSVPILFAAVGLFGVIGALFGPIKYGILPDHLQREELPAGNALVEGATFLAILLGQIVAGLGGAGGGSATFFAVAVLGFAALCYACSRFIPPTGEAAPSLSIDPNVLASTSRLLGNAWSDSRIWRTSLMVAWFWGVGIVVVALMPSLAKNTLGGSEQVVTVFLAIFSVGVALGSALAAWLAHGRIVLVPTPIAGVLMAIFLADIGFSTIGVAAPAAAIDVASFFHNPAGIRAAIDFFGVAVSGGLFVVPAFSAVQAWSKPAERARVIAGVNVLAAGFMAVASLGTATLQGYGVATSTLFLATSALCLVAGILIVRFLPTSPVRDLLSIIFRVFYRLEARGLENFTKVGDHHMIVALNHVSFLDAALALSILDRDPVFAIDQWIARRWWVRPFLPFVNFLPLDSRHPMATRRMIQAVREGKTLVIFPEGRLTATGSLMKVYDGAGLVAEKSGALVVPVRIDGLEQTPFTRLEASQVKRRWWPKVTVTVLEPVKLTIRDDLRGKERRAAAGSALYQVMSDLVFRTTATGLTVPQALIAAARRHGSDHIVLEDPVSGFLSYKKMLIGASVLGRKLMPLAQVGGAVGVMLPNANGAAVAVIGLMSAGRVPAMINFTAGATNILAACKAAEVKTIVTSRAFIEKGNMQPLVAALSKAVDVLMLEDVRKTVTLVDKLRALLSPYRPLVARQPDDPAAILFTSGSEGVPKGVVLSHANMLANTAQGAARIEFGRTDKFFNVLPIFHSFGLTVGLILPLVSGCRVYLYPSPLHYRIVPELIYSSNATVLLGTDTFLMGYARTANPYDFRSLRLIVAGAEPVKLATRQIYMEKFGLRILEGYGVTEAAPALTFNTPMFSREGTVGRLLPGIEARLDPVPGIEGAGRLVVRGPNVMLGYLRPDKPGVLDRPSDGWHDTGDIVAIDDDGFITIRGRAKRFAKIGGEMISMAAVEMLVSELWPENQSAVTAVPDPKRGERLVLVTDKPDANRAAVGAFARQRGASELMVPSDVLVAPALPLLGSGKVDHPAVARMVAQMMAA
ncbi:MAG TPA: acyl-[ACP]--phospholipid O-acyltransferase [Bauldia sp.]|nr:acyl-[ACP]--phospholipid O-acyltransferase [Bauldia sp.]